MIVDTLLKIEESIPEGLKAVLKKKLNRSHPIFADFSSELRKLVLTNEDVKNALFKDAENAIPYSGEILAATFHDFWIKNINKDFLEDCFLENMRAQTGFFS